VSLQEAQQAVALLQDFMRDASINDMCSKTRNGVNMLADALSMMRIKKTRQDSILNFFGRVG
jgi:hypothetical protein